MNDARAKTLITVDELVRLMDTGTAVVLLDVIDEQGAAPEERPKIPGALSVHLATDFSGTLTATSGRRPLPDVSDLQARARAWHQQRHARRGLRQRWRAQASRVVDAALGWVSDARMLDGGYGAAAAGRPSSTNVATAPAARATWC